MELTEALARAAKTAGAARLASHMFQTSREAACTKSIQKVECTSSLLGWKEMLQVNIEVTVQERYLE